ncbi:MAG: di-heme oxidoredictase family protein [Solimonas sp.]
MSRAWRLGLWPLLTFAVAAARPDAGFGRATFRDLREPQAYAALMDADATAFEMGQRVLNTQWVPAGTPRAGRIDGLGPLFNVGSCDGCHNDGARGRGIDGDGPAPSSLVLQLAVPGGGGDSVYGHMLNAASIAGLAPEAKVRVEYATRSGRYADGKAWVLREPRYRIDDLSDGPLSIATVVQPRLPPALYGTGLLERIDDVQRRHWRDDPRARRDGIRGTLAGRFGWQGGSVSIAGQTAKAFAREMGLTTRLMPVDDCTPSQVRCRLPDGGSPEVSDELFGAVLRFQQLLAVPKAVPKAIREPDEVRGAYLFAAAGCALCHRPAANVRFDDGATATIRPYSDLLLHDLGPGLADRDVAGRVVASRWRTAPLWGAGLQPRVGKPAYLHDGRAVSLEEAVLWHDGEAAAARVRFLRFSAACRADLLRWLATR